MDSETTATVFFLGICGVVITAAIIEDLILRYRRQNNAATE